MKKPKCTTLSYTGMDAPLVGRLWLAVQYWLDTNSTL